MKLSISNIAWEHTSDEIMYSALQKMGYAGLEIAPTRIFPEQPYEQLQEAEDFAFRLKNQYNLSIPSMQSIWFGQTGNLFGAEEERQGLMAYTKKAILFAEQTGCGNLVFGCPRNRNMPQADTDSEKRKYYAMAVDFFTRIAAFAAENHCVIGMEANPPIYNTNFINTTKQAHTLVLDVQSQMTHKQGFGINLDVGTMIQNAERVSDLTGMIQDNLISHVHISEPFLKTIQERALHRELIQALQENGYEHYVSIEMGKQDDLAVIQRVMAYVSKLMK